MLRRLATFVSHASIKEGKLVLENPQYFRTILSGYKDPKKEKALRRKLWKREKARRIPLEKWPWKHLEGRGDNS
jgi:hypothetical protein